MNRRYFGTDGVRGRAGGEVINERFAAALGRAAGVWAGGRGQVIVGRDTRASGPALAAALARGLASAGLEPVLAGVVPTPAIARAVRQRGAALGAMVTASHNPAEDNGIKFFGAHGLKLTDADEAAIEAGLQLESVPDVGSGVGFATIDVLTDYLAAAVALLPARALEGWTIVVDTANGATVDSTPAALRQLGATVLPLGDRPDGMNINRGVGSEYPARLAERVRESGARLGVAHDGDGDRCVLCDETGEVLGGDEILTLLATDALARGRLTGGLLVVTVQSNLGVDAAVRNAGGRVVRTAVGDRYVVERMLAEGAHLGGESSGHVVCADVSPTGDGLVAALRVLGVMRERGRPLSELRRVLRVFPQGTRNLGVAEKRPLGDCETLTRAIAALEAELGESGRVLVRYSGTESKLRLLVEATNDAAVAQGLAALETAARADLRLV